PEHSALLYRGQVEDHLVLTNRSVHVRYVPEEREEKTVPLVGSVDCDLYSALRSLLRVLLSAEPCKIREKNVRLALDLCNGRGNGRGSGNVDSAGSRHLLQKRFLLLRRGGVKVLF